MARPGEDVVSGSSGSAGRRGGGDSGSSFASESPELSLCSVRRLDVGTGTRVKMGTGEKQRDERWWQLAEQSRLTQGAFQAALPVPGGVSPLVRPARVTL